VQIRHAQSHVTKQLIDQTTTRIFSGRPVRRQLMEPQNGSGASNDALSKLKKLFPQASNEEIMEALQSSAGDLDLAAVMLASGADGAFGLSEHVVPRGAAVHYRCFLVDHEFPRCFFVCVYVYFRGQPRTPSGLTSQRRRCSADDYGRLADDT
jgi:hypothetical protein